MINTLLECPFLEFHPNENVTYNITHIVDTTLVQYHPINLHILNVARILHYPFWALECQPPCLCFMETVVPHILLITITHHEHPFTMTIISSLSSRTASPPICHIKKSAQGTKISSSHDYVGQYFVSLFQLKWNARKCRPDRIVHNDLYYSARQPRHLWFMEYSVHTLFPKSRCIAYIYIWIMDYYVEEIPRYFWITRATGTRMLRIRVSQYGVNNIWNMWNVK